jgi:hypothetical protein
VSERDAAADTVTVHTTDGKCSQLGFRAAEKILVATVG